MSGWRDVAAAMGLPVSDAEPEPRPMKPPADNRGSGRSKARRPTEVKKMIGQDELRLDLTLAVQGARVLGEHPGNFLLFGPSGLGKTSVAGIISHEMGSEMFLSMGSQLTTAEALVSTLTQLSKKRLDVLFIDEIHRIPAKIAELLYLVMEDGYLVVTLGRGADAQTQTIDVPQFILVGATTLPGWLDAPFRQRFQTELSLEFYSVPDLARIITNDAAATETPIEEEAALELARRSRGTPREAVKLLKICRSTAAALSKERGGLVTTAVVNQALTIKKIDNLGLTKDDRAYLGLICTKHKGGPVGPKRLAPALGWELSTIEELEVYLVREGFISLSMRGRMATEKTFTHLGIDMPPGFNPDAQGREGWVDA